MIPRIDEHMTMRPCLWRLIAGLPRHLDVLRLPRRGENLPAPRLHTVGGASADAARTARDQDGARHGSPLQIRDARVLPPAGPLWQNVFDRKPQTFMTRPENRPG